MRGIMRLYWLTLLAPALLEATAHVAWAQTSQPRQVAAPASDIVAGIVRLPDPAATPTESRAAVLPLAFARAKGDVWNADLELPIDHAGDVALALLSPDAGSWRILVATPGNASRPIEELFVHVHSVGPAGDELLGWVVDRYDLSDAPSGTWSVRVQTASSSSPAPGWLVARTASDLRIEAHVTTQRLVADGTIGVVARLRGSDRALEIDRARLVLESAGTPLELALHDDGEHEDGARGDGLFGAVVPATVHGDVRARIELGGRLAGGDRFLRTAALSFPVLEPRLLLDGPVETRVLDDVRLEIALGALPLAPPQRLHVSAEVWGRDGGGEPVPVCWLSRQVEPQVHAGRWLLPLVLDTRWLDVASARTPLELRAVRVQDPDTEVVLDARDRIVLDIAALPRAAGQGTREVTAEMLTGSSSLTLGTASPGGPHTRLTPTAIAPALMLVHGYCSGGSPWPAADFTQPKVVFLDPSANRTHDQFAQLLDQKAQQAGLSSFGLVAHSQGGAAALHLFTYYQSALDLATGGRRIQSVATPYQGTPLASLGAFACGVNNDMTPAGSATWLAGIPSWARSEVFTWTTANSGSACNPFTSLLLSDPEDGTVEKFRGELPGGNNMGHVIGWCHTTGMSNPANYTDHARNQAMNAAAAR